MSVKEKKIQIYLSHTYTRSISITHLLPHSLGPFVSHNWTWIPDASTNGPSPRDDSKRYGEILLGRDVFRREEPSIDYFVRPSVAYVEMSSHILGLSFAFEMAVQWFEMALWTPIFPLEPCVENLLLNLGQECGVSTATYPQRWSTPTTPASCSGMTRSSCWRASRTGSGWTTRWRTGRSGSFWSRPRWGQSSREILMWQSWFLTVLHSFANLCKMNEWILILQCGLHICYERTLYSRSLCRL